MLFGADATVSAVILWKTHLGLLAPVVASLSCLLSLILVTAVLVVGVHRRNARNGETGSKNLFVGAASLGLFATAFTGLAAFALTHHHNSYLELAASAIPLSDIQPEQKRLVVEPIRRRTANSREYGVLTATAAATPLSPSLYAPQTFVEKKAIESMIAKLTRYADIDFQYAEKQQAALTDFRDKMSRLDPVYLRSWDQNRSAQDAAEQSLNQKEHEWLESSISLYKFADTHLGETSLVGGELKFTTDALKAEFINRRDQSKTQYQSWQEQFQSLAAHQQETRAKLGLQ